MDEWNIDEVAEWVQSVAGTNVSKIFKEQEINGRVLMHISQEELERIGIKLGRAHELIALRNKMLPLGIILSNGCCNTSLTFIHVYFLLVLLFLL